MKHPSWGSSSIAAVVVILTLGLSGCKRAHDAGNDSMKAPAGTMRQPTR